MAKVYLETSFFSACVSTRTDPRTAGWRVTSKDWWSSQANRHELFISAEVVQELSAPEFPHRADALRMLHGLKVLTLTPEIEQFAALLVSEQVMPGPATQGDALQVAVSTFYSMDYLLTWNVKHLANINKRRHFAIICMRIGLIPPMLVTPDFLQETCDD